MRVAGGVKVDVGEKVGEGKVIACFVSVASGVKVQAGKLNVSTTIDGGAGSGVFSAVAT